MPKTLAQIRESENTGGPRRSIRMCLATGLLAEMQSLTTELAEVLSKSGRGGDDDEARPPTRLGNPEPPRVAEIQARMAELDDELGEHTGELVIQGIDDGEWGRWVDAHPPREEGERGYDRDARTAFGICNADALKDDLGRYAFSWNGEPLAEGDWDVIRKNAAPGDLKEMCQTVVMMHETAVDLPKLRELWREGMTSVNA